MVSVASGGKADRIAERILFKVPRAGSGTPAKYSSTFFGAPLPLAEERRSPDFTFFMRVMLRGLLLQVHCQITFESSFRGGEKPWFPAGPRSNSGLSSQRWKALRHPKS